MKNIFIFLIAYIVSYLLFYILYKKLNIRKRIEGKRSKKIICFLLLFVFCIGFVSISDEFIVTLKYHDIIMGLCMGPVIAFIPFLMGNNKRKN